MSDCVIFDADGTLCDVRPIRHYVINERNYDKFHRASAYCDPMPAAKILYSWVPEDLDIIVVTARQEKYREITEGWLEKHGFDYSDIYMRGNDDFRPDYVCKRYILEQIYQDGWTPILAVDDNPNVIALWSEYDIPTLVVPGYGD